MIAELSGRLISKSTSHVILDVNGVGYEVSVSLSTFFSLPELGNDTTLKISTQLRNESIQLFGFLTIAEKEAFTLLTGITGIGPKLALSTLSSLSVTDLLSAIQTNDVALLSSVPGIGKKSAGRIALELKDKVNRLTAFENQLGESTQDRPPDTLQDDAVSALLNLGYRGPEVKKAIQHILQKGQDAWSLESLIRESLKELAKS